MLTLVLPKDWKIYYDEEGDPYYVNVKTGENSWEKPNA